MATTAGLTEVVLYDTLVNYLISMARVVETAMNRALDAIVGFDNQRTAALPGEVFLLEPRINEMEIMIDEHAIRLLRRGSFNDDEMRLIVAALKITNDLERIGDIAVNLAERVITLARNAGSATAGRIGADGGSGAGHGEPEPGGADLPECGDGDASSGKRRRGRSIPGPHLREPAAAHEHGRCAGESRGCNSCWRRGTWNASRIMLRILPKTLFSGCAGWTCVTGED